MTRSFSFAGSSEPELPRRTGERSDAPRAKDSPRDREVTSPARDEREVTPAEDERAVADQAPDIDDLLFQMDQYQAALEEQNRELRRAKADLEAAHMRYRDLFAEAPVGLLTVGVQGKILMCNRRAAKLLRLTLPNALRRRITEFMSPPDAALFGQYLARLYRTMEPTTMEVELRRTDGRLFWAELTMHLVRDDDHDDTASCRVAIWDQTERRRLLAQNSRLAAIVASSAQAVYSENLDGVITSWNAGAERLFGYEASEAFGQKVEMLVPSDRAAEEEEIRARAMRQESLDDESVRVRRDGTLVPVFISASPIIDNHGRVTGVAQIVRDITEQVTAREHVARLLDSLRQADRRKDDFIATLAHELRNPLAPIRNAAAVLHFSPDLSPKLQWCRDVINRQVGHMAALLEDLLDVSRLTRDKITLRLDRVEISTAISQAIELNRPMIESRGHRLSVRLPAHPIVVDGDLTRLTQIFGNLLNNAAKYTDPGGEISITTECRGDDIHITVRDNGIGIKPENLGSIFELFAQVEGSREGPESGLGIGLALVKGLVERHKGSIVARSAGLGHGSEFIVCLPIAHTAVRNVDSDDLTASRSRASGRALRVMIVDDNVDAAETLALILRARDHEVQTAYDGERAIELAGEFRPHLVVLDIGMPRLTGYEVAQQLRQEAWGKEIVLVACTGWGQPTDRHRSEEAGFDHHLVKPVDANAIIELVSKLEIAEPNG